MIIQNNMYKHQYVCAISQNWKTFIVKNILEIFNFDICNLQLITMCACVWDL